MRNKIYILIGVFVLYLSSCINYPYVAQIKNDKVGAFRSTAVLKITGEKKFPLDSITAPKVEYSQLYLDSGGTLNYTFINKHDKSIYFYDYESSKFLKKISLAQPNIDESFNPVGYFIKSKDSIYVYNMSAMDMFIADHKGKFYNRISLINNKNLRELTWVLQFPQYYPQSGAPFIRTSRGLIMPGQYMSSIPNDIINQFKFTACINFENDLVSYYHKYPPSLYGSNSNWEGGWFTQVFTELSHTGNKLVFSFPISHDLYVSDLNSDNYSKFYAGSSNASTIKSIDAEANKTSRAVVSNSFLKNDEYGTIKYDPFRQVYYRFFRKGLTSLKKTSVWQDKALSVIILDENFKYLGETPIGILKNWYLQNIFVTKEGLNIEFIGDELNEEFLTLKIFALIKKV